MASFKNFSKKKRAELDGELLNGESAKSYDPIREESLQYEEWAKLLSYYRYYIDRFAIEILGLKLYPFQKLILRAMAQYPFIMLFCCRGVG